MDRPLAMRRTAGLLVLLAAAGTVVSLATLVPAGGDGVLVLLAFFGWLMLPTVVAVPFLAKVGDEIWRGRHAGDRLLFWSLLWVPGPLVHAVGGFVVARALLAAVVVALLLYLTGTWSKYDWPDATGGSS